MRVALRYRFTDGFRARVSPEVAAKELERIQEESGRLTPEGIFEAAKPEDAPLHGEFIWDGSEAVRQLGLARARQIVRAVVVVKEREDGSKAEPRRVWVHVADEGKLSGEYEKIEVVARRPDQYRRAITELQTQLGGAIRAVSELRLMAEGDEDAVRVAAVSDAERALNTAQQAVAALAS